MKRKKVLRVALICGLLITVFPLAATAAPSPSPRSQDEPPCSPRAQMLSQWMGVECPVLMDLQAAGVGLGVIMKAYFLSQTFAGLDWQDLVARHMSEEGLGWGQIMKAYTLASVLPLSAKELLDSRSAGMGWGQILKPYRNGLGKPPWAGQGPPPWAHRGKPPWAGPHKPKE